MILRSPTKPVRNMKKYYEITLVQMDAQTQGRQECSKEKEESKEECSKSRKPKRKSVWKNPLHRNNTRNKKEKMKMTAFGSEKHLMLQTDSFNAQLTEDSNADVVQIRKTEVNVIEEN
ncbi:hypothetical protein Tco_1146333 [Tanacetum coccineum]